MSTLACLSSRLPGRDVSDRRQSCIAAVLPQRLLDRGATPSQPGAYRAHRHSQGIGDLVIAAPLHVDEYDDQTKRIRKRVDRTLQVRAQQPIEECALRIAPPQEKRLVQLLEQRKVPGAARLLV